MQIRVLGFIVVIGSGLATTSFLVDNDILIEDCNGVAIMGMGQMLDMSNVFLSEEDS